MGTKKMPIVVLIGFAGALFAFLAGSGFASGQEVMQFSSGRGNLWSVFLLHIISLIVMYTSYSAYAYAGRTRNADNVADVFSVYAGKVLGKIFAICAWLYGTGCYVFMVSGFGGTLNQQWGVPVPVGCAVAVVISVVTVLLGLRRLVDIIGKIGPVILVFTLVIAIGSAFHFFPLIGDGLDAINSGEVQPVIAGGTNPVLAGLSMSGTGSLLVAAFVGRMGADLREYNFKYNKIIFFATIGFYLLCSIILGLDHIGNIRAAATAAIPNLLLCTAVFGGAGAVFATIFAIIILAAIYSTICPLLWGCVSEWLPDEKHIKYKLSCVVVGVIVYFVCLFVPYQTLLNYIMTYCGYAGSVIAIVCGVRYLIVRRQDRKASLASAEAVAD